ncbi:MAG: 6-carboxytetrahydropterin synthase QueD [Acidimicrobiia bacterium]|nr:6-carboxytetrahydropterin synthase QueD [Acidimicrobiia bacterium]
MFEVSVTQTFAAAHQLRNYKGKCENLHGHNYKVEVTLESEELNRTGLVADFSDLKRLMKAVIDRLDHRYLNEVPPFDVWNPSAENIALHFYQEVCGGLEDGVRVSQVKVWETETSVAVYRPPA